MNKLKVAFALCVIAVIVVALLATRLWGYVEANECHVVQDFVGSNITAKTTPGVYWRGFGNVYQFPTSETYFFTKDSEGGPGNASVSVRFNDGSTCDISGTCRVEYPRVEKDLVYLVRDSGFKDVDSVEDKLILPTLRRVLTLEANNMTSKESYSDRKQEFIFNAKDQIENGIYITETYEVKEVDTLSGQPVTRIKKRKIIDPKTG